LDLAVRQYEDGLEEVLQGGHLPSHGLTIVGRRVTAAGVVGEVQTVMHEPRLGRMALAPVASPAGFGIVMDVQRYDPTQNGYWLLPDCD
jgi:hypothetical protein